MVVNGFVVVRNTWQIIMDTKIPDTNLFAVAPVGAIKRKGLTNSMLFYTASASLIGIGDFLMSTFWSP